MLSGEDGSFSGSSAHEFLSCGLLIFPCWHQIRFIIGVSGRTNVTGATKHQEIGVERVHSEKHMRSM